MKYLLILLSLMNLAASRSGAQAPVGSVANDFTHSIGSAALASNRFTALTASNFSAHEGSIIVACYYTPW